MAFSCVTRNLFSIVSLLVILSITPLATSVVPSLITKGLVDRLCSDPIIHKNFCVAWLTYDPTTFAVNIYQLVDLIFSKTQLFAYKNLAMMKGLVATTTDPMLKATYGSCVTGYESAIAAIKEAQGFSISKSNELASQRALKAIFSLSTCAGQLEGRKNVPAYVPQPNLLFIRMCTIDSSISNILAS